MITSAALLVGSYGTPFARAQRRQRMTFRNRWLVGWWVLILALGGVGEAAERFGPWTAAELGAWSVRALVRVPLDPAGITWAENEIKNKGPLSPQAQVVLVMSGRDDLLPPVRIMLEGKELRPRFAAMLALSTRASERDAMTAAAIREISLADRAMRKWSSDRANRQQPTPEFWEVPMSFGGLIINDQGRRNPALTVGAFLDYPDAEVRRGVLVFCTDSRHFDPDDPKVVEHFDYHADPASTTDARVVIKDNLIARTAKRYGNLAATRAMILGSGETVLGHSGNDKPLK